MLSVRISCHLLATTLLWSTPVAAQGPATAAPSAATPNVPSGSDASYSLRKNARTITLKIPAPRGQIVDRDGQPFAQNEVAYQVALQYTQFENATREFVIQWARTRLNALNPKQLFIISKSDDELFDHYKNRRWLPLLVSGQLREKEAHVVEAKLPAGLILQPVYRRSYPHGALAAHIIGYSGSVGRLPTGPINFNDPLWEESEGRAGLEKIYDSTLTGDAGTKRLIFGEDGNKLLEDEIKRPKPGGTVVTTLNLKWQKLAEKVLANGCRRGAFVVIDVATGEVLLMASRPAFDLNNFIPSISEKDFKALQADVTVPMLGRAFQSAYPPASSFKPVVALAALNNGMVKEDTEIYCPASLRIGDHTFKNWSPNPEGSIDVKRALARSCNPWFYQVGIKTGPNAFLGIAQRLGYGSKSGLPLLGETAGLVPTDDWMAKNEHRKFLDGDTANLSIGQGSLLASPLQVAQAMAGIANGGALPKLQLIRQVQDAQGRVIQTFPPAQRTVLNLSNNAVEIVRQGMRNVVSAGYGTGRSAGLSYTTLCGKTGTAQWGPTAKQQRLAWFAGFLPYKNPRFAFAVLYEGKPGETVSGGRMAAPMVKEFFEEVKADIQDIIKPPKKAMPVAADQDAPKSSDPKPPVLRAIPVPEGGDVEDDGVTHDTDVAPATPETSEGPSEEPPMRAEPVHRNSDDEVNDVNLEDP